MKYVDKLGMERTVTKKRIQKKTADKTEVAVYNQKGKESEKISLPENIFSLPWNADLVHQVVVSMQSNARKSVAHVKDRSEVRGGGIKPWKQKGTGRARHGSIRSPLWVGGGVTHGPNKDKDYSKKINKKMKTKALYTVLSKKLKDCEILFVDSLSFGEPKTKEARGILEGLSKIKGYEGVLKKKNNAALILSPENSAPLKRSFNNIGNVKVEEARNVNPVAALTYKYLIIVDPKQSVDIIGKKRK